MFRSVVFALLALLLIGCGGGVEVVETAVPATQVAVVEAATNTPVPTNTLEPTIAPTKTAAPTNTAIPEPTNTAVPTNTPSPAKPTATSEPEKELPTEVPVKTQPIPTSRPLTDTTIDVFSILEKSQLVSDQVKTVQFQSIIALELGGMTQNMDMDCVAEMIAGQDESRENSYCLAQMSFSMEGEPEDLEVQFEMVQLGGEAWVRVEGEEVWVAAPQDDSSLSASNQLSLEDLEPYLLDAQIAGETEINGEVVYEITFDLDMIAFLGSVLGQDFVDEMPEDLDEFFMSVRYWIGQDDLLTRKAVIEMSMQLDGESFDIGMNFTYSNYNEPVEIPDPREVESEAGKDGD